MTDITSLLKDPTKSMQNTTPSCICEALSLLYIKSRMSQLCDAFMESKDVKSATSYLRKRLQVTPIQAVLLSIIYERSEDEFTSISDIAKYLGSSVCLIKSMKQEFDDLTKRRIVHTCYYGKSQALSFFMDREVINAYYNDEAYEYEKPIVESEVSFYAQMDSYYCQRFARKIGVDELNMQVDELLEVSADLELVQKLNGYMLGLKEEDRRLFLFFVMAKFKNNDDHIRFQDFQLLFREEQGRTLAYRMFQGGSLVQAGLAKVITESDSRPLRSAFCLNNEVAKDLGLSEVDESTYEIDEDGMTHQDKDEMIFSAISPNDIVKKGLFYNEKEQREMDLLTNLLNRENYDKVQAGLEEKGMRGGLCVLFYGAPGTGKTEGAKQLAKSTGRDLMIVDFSQIRSRWVGDSEKNTKRIFDEYRKLKSKSKEAPILLLNEADAILGKRMELVNHSSDKMENTMQNILLQQMEDFDGIMIATTNLATILDPAFERRFLVKLGFEKPAVEARVKIWMAMVPELTEAEALQLAETFDIAGGNMENVVRNRIMEEILFQKPVNFDRMLSLCEEEVVSLKGSPRRIGF